MQAHSLPRLLILASLLPALAACSGSSDEVDTSWATGATGGTSASGGSGGSGGPPPSGELGTGVMMGQNTSSERYYTAQVSRDDVPYLLITNGWGPGFMSHTISWLGTSFVVEQMTGMQGMNYEPASYPTVFCGKYSIQQVPACGLPAAIDTLGAVKTGWRWAANGNVGAYNAAYDIWLGDGSSLQSYLMVWLRDPPGAQPAGSRGVAVTVPNVPGTWNIWSGTVNRLPIVNYVKTEGADSAEVEFDVLDFIADARMRALTLPGTHVNAVAVGFEIWSGPITNLATEDFYVHVE